MMTKGYRLTVLLLMAIAVVGTGGMNKAESSEKTGEQLFKEHCALCHPDGGNIVNPKKTLLKKTREANKIKSADDIIKKMRAPGPGMTAFDVKTISEKDARKIADYILKSFNK